MPLPAALQARLMKRGIVPKGESSKEEKTDSSGQCKGCPNTTNPYHECSEYCHKRYGRGAVDHTQAPHIKDYSHVPLPPNWYFIPDPAGGRHYYWNTSTNQVSWLHPMDPAAEITLPASVLNKTNNDIAPNREIPTPLSSQDSGGLSIGRHPSLMKGSQKRQEAAVKRKLSDREQKLESKRGKSDAVDPMDPSSYSDAPRGDWSSGLHQKGDAKTGVDVTANGPLFQQRPYPSPGAILRANKQ
ncbi:predicted protein, partial [Nematostella vectensis]